MEISFSRAEYRTLLEVFQVMAWVLYAYKEEEDPDTKKYRVLEQKVFSFAEEAGFADLIEYAPDFEKFFPTRKFDEDSPALEYIEDYNDDMFWDELAERLAYRDVIEIYGEGQFEDMPSLERYAKIDRLREAYMDEFVDNGLERLRLEE